MSSFIVSVLGLKSGYTVKYGMSHQDFPWAAPSGSSSALGHNTDTINKEMTE